MSSDDHQLFDVPTSLSPEKQWLADMARQGVVSYRDERGNWSASVTRTYDGYGSTERAAVDALAAEAGLMTLDEWRIAKNV